MIEKKLSYKNCCNKVCLLSHCEVLDAGGCYCVCKLVDAIHSLEGVINGTIVNKGCVYFPEQEDREKWFNALSKERQEEELLFRTIEAPIVLEELKKTLKDYERS